MQIGDRVEVHCDRLSYGGGRAVARHEGAVIFVRGAAPQESVVVEIDKVHKNYYEAHAVQVLAPSPVRRDPICPVFGSCGGCTWQHIQYPAQLKAKEAFLRHALRNLTPPGFNIPMWGAAEEFNYRNRIQLHKKNAAVGYFARGTHELISITECAIADQKINNCIQQLQTDTYRDGKYEISVETDGTSQIKPVGKGGVAFRQINFVQNEQLKKIVIRMAEAAQAKEIIELYAGSGNFTFALSRALPNVPIFAIESHAQSVQAGQRFAHLNNFSNLRFIKADAGKYLKRQAVGPQAMLLVDPPRVGLDTQLIADIRERRPQTIIYVSCNLSTLERDLTKLAQDYEVVCAEGVDMFPQTDYLESVIQLALRPKQ